MTTHLSLIESLVHESSLIGAAAAENPKALAKVAGQLGLKPRVDEILARMAPGFQPLDTCPEGGWVWVRGGPYAEPTLRTARGERWRADRRAGRSAPTHWAEVRPPSWNE